MSTTDYQITRVTTVEQGRELAVNWDALRDIMQHDVTMWRNIAAKFTAENMTDRMIARCDAQAEHAQRVLDAMDNLEKAGQASVTP